MTFQTRFLSLIHREKYFLRCWNQKFCPSSLKPSSEDPHFRGGGCHLPSLLVIQRLFHNKTVTLALSALALIIFNSNFSLSVCPCVWFILSGFSKPLRIFGVVCFSLGYFYKKFPSDDLDLTFWCYAFLFSLYFWIFCRFILTLIHQ